MSEIRKPDNDMSEGWYEWITRPIDSATWEEWQERLEELGHRVSPKVLAGELRRIRWLEEDGELAQAAHYRERLESGSLDGPWNCIEPDCGLTYPTMAALEWHMQAVHDYWTTHEPPEYEEPAEADSSDE